MFKQLRKEVVYKKYYEASKYDKFEAILDLLKIGGSKGISKKEVEDLGIIHVPHSICMLRKRGYQIRLSKIISGGQYESRYVLLPF